MPARRLPEITTERYPHEHSFAPPISPFASADAGYDSDESSADEAIPRRVELSPGSNNNRRRPIEPQPDRGHSTRATRAQAAPERGAKRMPTMVGMLLVPAFLMLVLVATVVPSHGQPSRRSRKGGLGQRTVGLAHSFGWGSDREPGINPVQDFLDLFQVSCPGQSYLSGSP